MSPWDIRQRYRTTSETAVIGESLAGLFVMETFFVEPDLFDRYIAFSPSWWWNDEALVKQAGARLKSWPAAQKTLYFSSANEDNIAPAATRLADALRASTPAGLVWSCRPMPDEFHDTNYRAAAPKALRTVFASTVVD